MSQILLMCAIKSTVVLAVAGGVAALLRRSSAALRHAVWLAAIGAVLLLPFAGLVAPVWQAVPRPLAAAVQTPLTIVDVVASRGGWNVPWSAIVTGVWVAGMIVVLLRMLVAARRVARVARRATAFRQEEGVDIRISQEASVPMVAGVLRPVVLLPAEASDWPEERLRVVLRHELTHVARWDTLTQALAQVVCAAYWFQPLMWWAITRLRHECEEACDDSVVARGEKATVYAGHLIEIVRGIGAQETLSEGGIAMARKTELEQRLRAMLMPNRDRTGVGRRVAAGLAAASVAVLIPLAALRAPAQDVGVINGVVRDPSGGVVPKARVTLKWPGSDRVEFAITKADGAFSFKPIPVGEYFLNVAKPGFVLFDSAKFVVAGDREFQADVVLSIGSIRETMDVTAERVTSAVPGQAANPPQRIKVGGNVMAAKLVHKARVAYPPDCKRDGVEGTVMFRGVIGLDGSILSLEQINQLVDPRLVEAAREGVKQWRYEPTLLNGNPVEVITQIQVNFTLAR